MPAPRQLDFFTPRSFRQLQEHARRTEHGGDIRRGRRKLARPFERKRPLHLTLRSSRARGEWSFSRLRKAEAIQRLAYKLARENGVRIYQYANAGNHLHLLLRAKTHAGFKRFLRTFSAMVPRIVTGARKGSPIAAPLAQAPQGARKFWDALAYTRIVNWGRHFFEGRHYVIRNELETDGYIPYSARKRAMRP